MKSLHLSIYLHLAGKLNSTGRVVHVAAGGLVCLCVGKLGHNKVAAETAAETAVALRFVTFTKKALGL